MVRLPAGKCENARSLTLLSVWKASIQTMASVDATALQRAIAGSGISEEAQMISGTGQFIVEQTYLCS